MADPDNETDIGGPFTVAVVAERDT